jgi:hypothetical protein
MASFTCAQATGWFPEYVAGRLGLTELALIEGHLAQCASCRQALQALASETDQPPPPRIRHRRWRPGRLIGPVASTATRAIAGIVTSRPRSSGSVRGALSVIRIGAPSLQSAASMLRHTASTVGAYAPSVPSVPSWLRRPHWRQSLQRSPSAMDSLVRIGSMLVALALIGGVWWLPPPDGSLAPVPLPQAPASSPVTQPPPMVTPAEPGVSTEVAPPNPVTRARPPSPRPARPSDTRRAPSRAPDSAIPSPERIPEGRSRPDSASGEVQPAPSSPDPAAAVDWLLRGEGRGTRSRSRADTP